MAAAIVYSIQIEGNWYVIVANGPFETPQEAEDHKEWLLDGQEHELVEQVH